MPTLLSQIAKETWADRFSSPTPDDVVEAIDRGLCAAVQHARQTLDRRGFGESFAWHGTWKWSFAYNGREAAVPAAFVIPDPRRPRICVPLSESSVMGIASRRVPKLLRDALTCCPVIDGVRWPTWDITGKEMVADLLGCVPVRA